MKKQLIAFLLVSIIGLGCVFTSSVVCAESAHTAGGKVAFVASEYLKAVGRTDRSKYQKAEVVLNDPSSHLNVRSGPSTDYEIVGTLKHGQTVTVILDRDVPRGWAKIRYEY